MAPVDVAVVSRREVDVRGGEAGVAAVAHLADLLTLLDTPAFERDVPVGEIPGQAGVTRQDGGVPAQRQRLRPRLATLGSEDGCANGREGVDGGEAAVGAASGAVASVVRVDDDRPRPSISDRLALG